MTNDGLNERIDSIDLIVDKHEESIMLLLKLRKHFKDQIQYKIVHEVDGLGRPYRKKVPR
jgi:uncharacterized Ntn-hydrolase superfamily protein